MGWRETEYQDLIDKYKAQGTSIPLEEFGKLCRSVGLDPTEADLIDMMDRVHDGNGGLDVEKSLLCAVPPHSPRPMPRGHQPWRSASRPLPDFIVHSVRSMCYALLCLGRGGK